MIISAQYLIDLGFGYEFVPKEKRWDQNKLIYFNFLDQNNTVSIHLKYNQKTEVWNVDFIAFTGDNALDILYREMKGSSSLESIIDFVRRNPRQTF